MAGVGSAVPIGWPARIKAQEAPGGTVLTRISMPFGGVPQPASAVRPRTVRVSLRRIASRNVAVFGTQPASGIGVCATSVAFWWCLVSIQADSLSPRPHIGPLLSGAPAYQDRCSPMRVGPSRQALEEAGVRPPYPTRI